MCKIVAGRVKNSVDPDQTPHSAASDLDQYFFSFKLVCSNNEIIKMLGYFQIRVNAVQKSKGIRTVISPNFGT